MNDVYQTVYFKNDRLGIFTENPTEALDVSGNTLIRDRLIVSGKTLLIDVSANDASFNNLDIVNSATFLDLSSNNAYFTKVKSNLLPDTLVTDISNVSQLTLGNSENIWKSSHIRDISVNKIGALFGSDISKNIIFEGNLVPEPTTFRDPSNNINSKFSLGTFNNRWKSLYVSDKTVFIGGSSLGVKASEQEQSDGSKKTIIELVFVPEAKDDTNNNETSDNTDTIQNQVDTQPSISIARGEFISKTQEVVDEDTGEVKQIEVIEAVEESFAAAKLLDLADVDISKNELNDGDKLIYDTQKEKFVIGVKDTVNNSNQTFAEILTQQPQKFTLDSSSNSTGSITLNWNYDDILLKDASLNNMKLTHISSTNVKDGMIPFIDMLHVDISGTTHGNTGSADNNTWINYNKGDYNNNGDRTIGTNESYDSNSFKKLIIQKTRNPSTSVERILSEAGHPISFRIYGKNNTDDSDEKRVERALYFNNLEFLTAQPPEIPTFSSETVSSTLILNYISSLAETGASDSLAKIIEAKINYQEIGRRVSKHALASQTDNSFNSTQTFSSLNISSNSTITLTVNQNLRKGTKYKYRISAKNNLNENHTSFSDFRNSDRFTNIPTSNLGTNLSFTENSSKTNIASDNLNSSNRIYINLSAGTDNTNVFVPRVNNSSNSDFQLSSNTFYGASLDNKTGLANIKVFINGGATAIQDASFNGYDITSTNNTFNNITNTSSAHGEDSNQFDFVSVLTDDIYSSNTNDIGFLLKGNLVMNSIQRKDITSLVGAASNTPKSIKYEYRRNTAIGGSNNINTPPFQLYVDDFSSLPSMVKVDPTISVTSIIYNMGIPSVHKFNIVFNTLSFEDTSRKYTQMNSTHKFVRGDLKIADITISGLSPNITKAEKKDILLSDKDKISSTGEYNLTNTNFESSITSYYQNIQYTSSTLTRNNKLTISEKIYSLTTGDSGETEPSTDLSMNHFCDRASFSSFTGSSPNTNAPSNLYEISDISNSLLDMSTFTGTEYTTHTQKVNDSTLLFINNTFRTNANQSYPNVSLFSYQGNTINTNSGYTSVMAATAYGLDGSESSLGYKWIGFKFTYRDILTDSGTNISYVNIYDLLNSYFNSGIMDKIRAGDADTRGIVKLGSKIGNLSKGFDSLSTWFSQGTSNKTLSSILSTASHGSAHQVSTTNWGPVLDPNDSDISSGIFIFIGLKNSVSL
jgi:hypothetical protein